MSAVIDFLKENVDIFSNMGVGILAAMGYLAIKRLVEKFVFFSNEVEIAITKESKNLGKVKIHRKVTEEDVENIIGVLEAREGVKVSDSVKIEVKRGSAVSKDG